MGTRAFDFGWRFHPGDVPTASQEAFDDAGWRRVDLPHDWSIAGAVNPKAPSGGAGGFFPTSVGWYRKSFQAPPVWRGRRVTVEFEGVYMNGEVWINGYDLGWHPYGFTSFFHDLTPYLNIDGGNVLAVRVDNSEQPNCRWHNGSGIYRHVWLQAADPGSIPPWGVFVSTVTASPAAARLRIEVTVRNETEAPVSLNVDTRALDPVVLRQGP